MRLLSTFVANYLMTQVIDAMVCHLQKSKGVTSPPTFGLVKYILNNIYTGNDDLVRNFISVLYQ